MRRGFTLVELIITTVVMVAVLAVIYRAVLTTQRVTRAQGEQLAVQSSVRGSVLLVVNELRELSTVESGSTAENDILSIGPGSIVYRAMRGFGLTCTASGGDQLRLDRVRFSGYRDPQAGRDSLLVLVDTGGTGVDPAWMSLPVSSVSTATGCPGSAPGITLTTVPSPWLSGTAAGTPVRIFEPMELRVYQSEGKSWLGTRSIATGEAIQPLFGPVSQHDGFQLQSRDSAGKPTADLTAISSILVSIHGVGGQADERLTTEVALRNAAP
jgi:prepilin-type N-terminal cleavage/methylation domain-containing protein